MVKGRVDIRNSTWNTASCSFTTRRTLSTIVNQCVIDVNIVAIIKLQWFIWALICSLLGHSIKWILSILPCAAPWKGIIILGIKTSTDAWLQDLVPGVLQLLVVVLIYNILLKLGILIGSLLQWNLLNIDLLVRLVLAYNLLLIRIQLVLLLFVIHHCSFNVRPIVKDIVVLISSNDRFSTRVLRLLGLGVDAKSLIVGILYNFTILFHLGIQSFPFFEDFHQFIVYFITI